MSEAESQTDQIALGHAWDWFSLHANQRLLMLRFYLSLNSAILAGVGAAYANNFYLGAWVASFLSFVITLIFFGIDVRTKNLIVVSEAALLKLQEALSKKSGVNELELQRISDQKKHKPYGSYKLLFRFMFATFAVTSLISLLTSSLILVCRL